MDDSTGSWNTFAFPASLLRRDDEEDDFDLFFRLFRRCSRASNCLVT